MKSSSMLRRPIYLGLSLLLAASHTVFAPVLLIGSVITPAHAQDAGRAERPDIKVGDAWIYQYSDNWKKLPNVRFTHTVIEAGSRYTVAVSNTETQERYSNATYSNEWNTYALAGVIYLPSVNDYAFPLTNGKTWKSSYSYKRADGGETRCEQTATVAGVERVAVAGGTFEAIKITINGSWKWASGGNYSGSFTKTLWYARDARRWVKLTYADFDAQGNPFANETWELVSHKLN